MRAYRGIWADGAHGYVLTSVQKQDGQVEEALTEKVKKDTTRAWMEGDFVTLRKPCHYMGFVVSPRVLLESYNKERMVGHESRIRNKADFFSYAAPSRTLDGDWNNDIRDGAMLLGKFITLCSNYTQAGTEERAFSVLLYQKPGSKADKREYTLQLLQPEAPDRETAQAFKAMRSVVEALKPNAYNPLYTTDFRIMTGRYYRVTVNQCGWLVEDYMDINR